MPKLSIMMLIAALLAAAVPGGPTQAGGPYIVHAVSPCRVVDTRNADPALSTFSGEQLAAGGTIPFFVTGNSIAGQGGENDCGIPYGTAKGVFINVFAVQPAGAVGKAAYLVVYPYGETRPLASTINYEPGTFALANGVMVPICDPALATCDYDLNVYNTMAVHFIVDITGYLAEPSTVP